jgi:ApaG protein
MNGSYFFVAEDGERFDVPIPLFLLEAHSSAHAPARVLH